MQIELENFLQKIGRYYLLLQFSGGTRLLGCLLRLFFQFYAFEAQQVFRALDRISQRAVSVVESGTLLQAPSAFLIFRLSEYVGMQAAAQSIEFFFQRGRVQIELSRKSKKGK